MTTQYGWLLTFSFSRSYLDTEGEEYRGFQLEVRDWLEGVFEFS